MRYGMFGLLASLWLALGLSGVAVVYAKFQARQGFVELQQLRAERARLDVDWGRLRLEEATLTTHARIEQLARRDLDMYLPRHDDIRLIWGVAHAQD